ncbi:hypothetical protein J1N35_001538 [Gossypium stocksii]|uniref:Uncharacterized protein n=1 Tax=Gossypium stocksii TaxID=47602 RepID=A0A9D3WK36_9ROSI|nr:hypothetical protein J1N35_001538 [Gossypium stocksii]
MVAWQCMVGCDERPNGGWALRSQSELQNTCRHTKTFPYYYQLTSIYAKDQATGKDAQTTIDIVEEIDDKDVATANNLEEVNNYHGCEYDVSLNEMDVSATQPQLLKPNQDGSTSSKKKKQYFLWK